MKLLVFATLLVIAYADVSHLGYQYGTPGSSYDVAAKSVTGPAVSQKLHLPVSEFQDFNFGVSGSSTPSPLLGSGFRFTTPAPSVDLNEGFVSSTTAAPLGFDAGIQGFNFGADQGIVSSTVAPNVEINKFNFGGDQGIVSSTVAPSVEINGFSTPSSLDAGFQGFNFNGQLQNAGLSYSQAPVSYNFGLNSFSTPAPQIDFDANSYVVQSSSVGGSINDAFGVSAEQEVAKHVYFYSAPEEHQPIRTRINIAPAQSAKKNVKYIFIKAPSAPAPAPIEIAPAPQAQEKTVVYVLVKKPEEEQQIFLKSPDPTTAPKPEVFFIKYKNQQEAEEAISKVQSGQAGGEAHQSAQNLEGSNQLIETINREASFKTQPIVNYVKQEKPISQVNSGFVSSNVIPNAGINSGLSYTTSLPVFNQGFSYTTPAPSLSLNSGFKQFQFNSPNFGSGFSYTTPAPIVNIGGLRAFDFQSRADLGQNLVSSNFGNSIVSSTEAPSVVSSTVAPEFFVSNGQSEVVGTSSPVPFSTYGSPYKK